MQLDTACPEVRYGREIMQSTLRVDEDVVFYKSRNKVEFHLKMSGAFQFLWVSDQIDTRFVILE